MLILRIIVYLVPLSIMDIKTTETMKYCNVLVFEPVHEQPTLWPVCPAKTQISQDIDPI